MAVVVSEPELRRILARFGPHAFSTMQFIQRMQAEFPDIWQAIEDQYGKGGKGAGRYYSANSRIAQALHYWSNRGVVYKLPDYRKAPPEWGNRAIRYWAKARRYSEMNLYPDEIAADEIFLEGAKTQVTVNKYERDPRARAKCISLYGLTCFVCGFDFGRRYGELGVGFIHVHHTKPLSEVGRGYKLDPKKHLRPVCPNCHAMLHHQKPALSIEKLKALLTRVERNQQRRSIGKASR